MEDDQGLRMIYQVIQDEHHLSQIWNKKVYVYQKCNQLFSQQVYDSSNSSDSSCSKVR